jgi:hypothetical protein
MTAPAELVEAARGGDAGAFEQLATPYRGECQDEMPQYLFATKSVWAGNFVRISVP